MTAPLAIFFFAVALLVSVIFWALFSHGEIAGQPSESRADLFEHDFTRWLEAHRDFPRLNHNDCSPVAANYGLTEEHANKIRARVRRDFERSA